MQQRRHNKVSQLPNSKDNMRQFKTIELITNLCQSLLTKMAESVFREVRENHLLSVLMITLDQAHMMPLISSQWDQRQLMWKFHHLNWANRRQDNKTLAQVNTILMIAALDIVHRQLLLSHNRLKEKWERRHPRVQLRLAKDLQLKQSAVDLRLDNFSLNMQLMKLQLNQGKK